MRNGWVKRWLVGSFALGVPCTELGLPYLAILCFSLDGFFDIGLELFAESRVGVDLGCAMFQIRARAFGKRTAYPADMIEDWDLSLPRLGHLVRTLFLSGG